MGLTEFTKLMGVLSVATAGRDLELATVKVYHAALADVPDDTLKAAVGRVAKQCKFFPSVAEIRQACDREKRDGFVTFTLPKLTGDVLTDDDPRTWFACVDCQDSGWASYWCVGPNHQQPRHPSQFLGISPCGKCDRFGDKGYGHEYVRRCACYQTNPNIRKRLEGRKTYAEQP